MTIGEWLKSATNKLGLANISSARLDALLLLEFTLALDRSHLLAHQDYCIKPGQLFVLNRLLKRRFEHEPIAYIRSSCEFYGRKFIVNKNVLVPRPESEAFIELLKKLPLTPNQKLLDIGTGSGILAITAKLEFPKLQVCGDDISKKAIKVAADNAKALSANVKFLEANLIGSCLGKYDYILANLPYVPVGYKVSPAANHEPSKALYSGKDGLDLIKVLAPLAYTHLKDSGYILLESLLEQQAQIKTIYRRAGFKLIAKSGLVQCFQKI
jgi:release factor glutamine methyltransferase